MQGPPPVLFYSETCENSSKLIGIIKHYPFLTFIRPVCVERTDNLPDNLEYTPSILAYGQMYSGSDAFGFVQAYITKYQSQVSQQSQQGQGPSQNQQRQQGQGQMAQQGQGQMRKDNRLQSEQGNFGGAMQRAAPGVPAGASDELPGLSLMGDSGSLYGVEIDFMESSSKNSSNVFNGATSDISSTNYASFADLEKLSTLSGQIPTQNGAETRPRQNQQQDSIIKNIENMRNRDIAPPKPRAG
jgi:hypothetical protein